MLTILLILFLAALSLGCVALVLNHQSTMHLSRQWVMESVDAWRSKKLTRDTFDVHMEETTLADLFTTFDHDGGDPYVSAEAIEAGVTQVVRSDLPRKILDGTEKVVARAVDVASHRDSHGSGQMRRARKTASHGANAQSADSADSDQTECTHKSAPVSSGRKAKSTSVPDRDSATDMRKSA
ncbi:hypothetical protein [Trueperella sp. LYQ143]|uniref:hypothetical protein n=1 Tax=unclassified Trueperella TaxID=2630174 RepID=UPI003982D8A4